MYLRSIATKNIIAFIAQHLILHQTLDIERSAINAVKRLDIPLFENVSHRQFKYTIVFTGDTRNQVSVDTNDRYLGQCIGRITVDSRDLTKLRRRRQW